MQGVFAAARDITEHKRAEAELARYRDHLDELVTTSDTAELARSNEDLEQFAYVASHDLQEPLRAVGGYVQTPATPFPEKLDVKAREYIAGAADGAERMERLIADLLAFSRVGTRGVACAGRPERASPRRLEQPTIQHQGSRREGHQRPIAQPGGGCHPDRCSSFRT